MVWENNLTLCEGGVERGRLGVRVGDKGKGGRGGLQIPEEGCWPAILTEPYTQVLWRAEVAIAATLWRVCLLSYAGSGLKGCQGAVAVLGRLSSG